MTDQTQTKNNQNVSDIVVCHEVAVTIVSEGVVGPKPTQKRRIRKRKSNGEPTKPYFTSDTQAAIVEYQQCTIDDKKQRELLYISRILPAFEKLVENLINIHKFTSLHDTFDELKLDCISFLFETIHKFDSTRGSNAFSYFNVVAKNWLIIKTKQKILKTKKNVSMNDESAMSYSDLKILEDWNHVPSQELLVENKNTAENIVTLLNDIKSRIASDNEKACIDSIISIFQNIDDIDLVNKSAVFLYMREMSGLTSKQLSTTMQIIKKHYRRMKLDAKYKLFI